jgi:hypothetical protein
MTHSAAESAIVVTVDVTNPECLANPGKGMFWPLNPVTAVGTAMIAAQPVTLLQDHVQAVAPHGQVGLQDRGDQVAQGFGPLGGVLAVLR